MSGKTVYVGLESSGKSLMMVKKAKEIVLRNEKWNKITGNSRPLVVNLSFSDKFISFAESHGVEIYRWRHLNDLVELTECDLFVDELATYFDSRLFADLPLNVRLWLAQAEKLGVHIVGAAQDFAQVDKSFRRLCKEVYEVRKVIGSRRPMKTAPPVRRIWGACLMWRLDPQSFLGEQVEMKTIGFPKPFFISRKDVEMFDTNQRVSLSDPPPLQRIVRHWYLPEDTIVKGELKKAGDIGYTKIKYI